MIIFNSVTKDFGPDFQPALKDVSFEVEPGELVLVTGHSGSGKTTLMKLMTKEYLPTQGEIFFDDIPLSSIKSSQAYQIRRKIGVVFQDYKLLNELTVWENISLALSIIHTDQVEIEQRVTDLLDLTGLIDKAFLFPQQLSGGEAQRVSIARALSTAPRVIFADEPTGNLDEDTSRSIVQLLKKINELGTTVFITTHDVTVREMLEGERNMRLEKGQLVEDSGAKHPKKSKVETKKTLKEKSSAEEKPSSTKGDKMTEKPQASIEEIKTEPTEAEAPVKSEKRGPRLRLPSFGKLFKRNAKVETKDVEETTDADDSVTVKVEEI